MPVEQVKSICLCDKLVAAAFPGKQQKVGVLYITVTCAGKYVLSIKELSEV